VAATRLGPLCVGVLSVPGGGVRWVTRNAQCRGDTDRVDGCDFAGLVTKQHGIRAERTMHTPALAGMLHLHTRNQALFHPPPYCFWESLGRCRFGTKDKVRAELFSSDAC
jgi:hypothetical protein